MGHGSRSRRQGHQGRSGFGGRGGHGGLGGAGRGYGRPAARRGGLLGLLFGLLRGRRHH